ncbi:hypothetical protein KEM54_002589 [Ascosphaera aggregata]|nr:hypothetical protein KEM54_002589 [Ascosphaera aggregata]
MWFFNWFSENSTGEREPLLPRHEPYDAATQRLIRKRLRLYFARQALLDGYMPSTEQLVDHLRTIYAADFLNPDPSQIGPSGQQFIKDAKRCINRLITLLVEKNKNNALQDIIWLLSRQGEDVKPDNAVAMEGVKDVQGGLALLALALTKPELRLFLQDLSIIGRILIADEGTDLCSAAAKLTEQPHATNGKAPSRFVEQDQSQQVGDVLNRFQNEAEVAIDSVTQQLTGAESFGIHPEGKNTSFKRIKETITELRKQGDYEATVSAVTELIKNYGAEQGQASDEGGNSAETAAGWEFRNKELRLTVPKLWDFSKKFGDIREWQALEQRLCDTADLLKPEPHLSAFRETAADFVHCLLMDPKFFETSILSIQEFRKKLVAQCAQPEALRSIDALLSQFSVTVESACKDQSFLEFYSSMQILKESISSAHRDSQSTLLIDLHQVIIPLLIRHLQSIPIERLGISVPEVDLLLENVILQPAANTSSLLPANILLTIQNDVSLKKVHAKRAQAGFRTMAKLTTAGLNTRAVDFGYWIQVHPIALLPPFVDTGIASFQLDERGIDITVDLEFTHSPKEQLIILHGVRAVIYKLDYTLKSGNKWAIAWWLMKPFLKHMIRRLLEKKIAEDIVLAVHNLNRIVLFARTRLKGSRQFDINDATHVLRALFCNINTINYPSTEQRYVDASHHRPDVFLDCHTPGGAAQIWKDEARKASQVSSDNWRCAVFDAVRGSAQAWTAVPPTGSSVPTQ